MGIIKAIDLALSKYKDRYGNKKFEEGERYVTVFNDAILIISYEDKTIHFDVIVGDPCIINKNIEEI
jgi:hypothetical protein